MVTGPINSLPTNMFDITKSLKSTCPRQAVISFLILGNISHSYCFIPVPGKAIAIPNLEIGKPTTTILAVPDWLQSLYSAVPFCHSDLLSYKTV